MIYLTQVSTAELREAVVEHPRLGQLLIPGNGNKLLPGVAWGADNGAFTGSYPGDEQFLDWLQLRARGEAGRCLFVAAPDVVGDWPATLERARPMLRALRGAGWPAGLVAQNGAAAPPWDELDCLFLGGVPDCAEHGAQVEAIREGTGANQLFRCPTCRQEIPEWKTGPEAAALAREGKARGKVVHMGRVNSGRRFRYADALGCDSADGTFVVRAPRTNLRRMRGWLDDALL